MPKTSDRLLFAVDLAGTFVFAVEGATTALASNLDVFGVMVLSFATALGGGIMRDLLIGAVPPQSIRDWRYAVVAFSGGAVAILFHDFAQRIPIPVAVGLDAAGLALFAVSGAGKALAYELNPFMAILMGRSPAWAVGRCAMFCLRGYRPSCGSIFMRLLLWRDRRS